MSFKQDKYYNKNLIGKIKILVLSFFCCILCVSVFNMMGAYQKAKKSTNEVLKNKEILINRQKELELLKEQYKTDFGKEKIIRERYGYVEEGEEVLFITTPREQANQNKTDDTQNKNSIYNKIKSFFVK